MSGSASRPAPRLRDVLAEPVPAVPPHRHLHVVRSLPPPPRDGMLRRIAVVALSLVAAGLFTYALAQPWWRFKLYAPQYPRGLTLVISLTGLSGDVREIDMLNHYIGMAHLDAAAKLEREYAAYAVAYLGLILLVWSLLAGRTTGRLIVALGSLFPLGFIADSFAWLYYFGHHLDRRAPLRIPNFTPQMFGNGSIGQFMTFAVPLSGFWIAVGGVALLLGVAILRGRVCDECDEAGRCVAVCKRTFLRPPSSTAKA